MADLLQDKKFSDFSEISSTQDKTIYFVGYEENGNNIKISDTNLLSGLERIEEVDDTIKFHINDNSIHKTDEDVNNLISISNQVKTINADTTNLNENEVKNSDYFIIYSTSNLYLDTLLTNVQEDCFVYCDVINKSDSTISIYNSSISTTNSIYKVKTNQVFSAKISKIIDGENILYKINVLEKEDTLMTDLLSSSVPKNELRYGNVYYVYKNISSSQSIEYDVINMTSGSYFRWQVGDANFANSSFFEVSNNRIVQAIYSGNVSNTRFILSNNVLDITAQQVNINGNNIIEPINSISTIQSELTSHVENSDIHKNEEQIKEIINETNQIKTIDVSTTNINETEIHNGDSFIIRTTSNLYLDTLLTNVQEDCFVYCDVINKSDSTISIYNSSISTTEPLYNLEQNSVFSTKISKIIDESIYKVDILEKGKSAYDIWIEEGNNGTESDFLNSLKGEKGDKAEDGKSAYEYATDSGYTGTESDFSQSLLASSEIVANFDHEKMMAWARAVCFSKAPYPEEFLIAEEATTEEEWQLLAPNTYAIFGEENENYVEYHPNSTGGRTSWNNSNKIISKYYYLVTKGNAVPNSGIMFRGNYNFIWNLDTTDQALRFNSFQSTSFKFWFVYAPFALYPNTLHNCIIGANASAIIIAPKTIYIYATTIGRDSETSIANVSTKHYIRCYLPSLNRSTQIAPYHRGIPSGLIFTLNSLPDVTGNSIKPTVTLGVDPDVVESTAEDGKMTFTDANLQTAVDNATSKGWTVAFNATPYPVTETTSDASVAERATTLTLESENNRWYHCELNEYGNYLNSEGDRVSITSAKGFFGGEDDGSWFKATSENEAANNWNLTYSPLSLQ